MERILPYRLNVMYNLSCFLYFVCGRKQVPHSVWLIFSVLIMYEETALNNFYLLKYQKGHNITWHNIREEKLWLSASWKVPFSWKDGRDEKLFASLTLLSFPSAAWQGAFVQLDVDGENLQAFSRDQAAASAQQHTRLDADLNQTASSQAAPRIWQALLPGAN